MSADQDLINMTRERNSLIAMLDGVRDAVRREKQMAVPDRDRLIEEVEAVIGHVATAAADPASDTPVIDSLRVRDPANDEVIELTGYEVHSLLFEVDRLREIERRKDPE